MTLRLAAVLFTLLLVASVSTAQKEDITDNILWAGFQMRKSYGTKWSAQIQPIIRYNDDLGNYQNSSIDYSLRHFLGKNWHVQVLGRTWFMPDRGDRQFIWFDVGKRIQVPALSLSVNTRLRWHLALDINDNFDADFMRLIIQLVPSTSWKLKPTMAIEPWYQFNESDKMTRLRFEPGLRYSFSKTVSITTLWRRQHDFEPFNNRRDNLWVAAMVFIL